MTKATRRKVSYVIKSGSEEHAHRLGVNSLALDITTTHGPEGTPGGILYSAGRDGMVAAWDLHFNFRPRKRVIRDHESRSEITTENAMAPLKPLEESDDDHDDDEVSLGRLATDRWRLDTESTTLFVETGRILVSLLRICAAGSIAQIYIPAFRTIAHGLGERHIISGSSDRTIKLWRPHSSTPTTLYTLGKHADYVKSLAYAAGPGWVASAGFDRKIYLWDVNESRGGAMVGVDGNSGATGSIQDVSQGASVYALATNPSGTVLVAGSPEKIVLAFDPRSGRRITKLPGHTDNIRALLVSDDGQLILSGSSDTTIKLWSLKAQRCLATYETHADSIWSLFSSHPRLQTFYAGSKDGLVTRTEIGGHNDVGVEGECVAVFKENSGVVKVIALEDKYIWTATSSSSVNRWFGITPRAYRNVAARSTFNLEIPSSAIIKLPPIEPPYTPVTDQISDSSPFSAYATSVLSVPTSYQEDDAASTETLVPVREIPDSVIEGWLLFQAPSLSWEKKCLNNAVVFFSSGKSGLKEHLMLNNRRNVLTVDTLGEVVLWDIVKAITVHLDETRWFDCEMYADEAELPTEFEVREDQRSKLGDYYICVNLGKWILRWLFDNFITAHISLYEELAEKQRQQELEFIQQKRVTTPNDAAYPVDASITDHRMFSRPPGPLNLTLPPPAPILTTAGQPLSPIPQSPSSPTLTGKLAALGAFSAPATTVAQQDYFVSAGHRPASPTSQTFSATSTGAPSGPGQTIIQPPPPAAFAGSTVTGSAGIMGRLRHFGVKKLTRTPSAEAKIESTPSNGVNPPLSPTTERREQDGKTVEQTENEQPISPFPLTLRGGPLAQIALQPPFTMPPSSEVPSLVIPTTTTVIIAEESPEASTSVDLYRGTVASVGDDVEIVEEVAPIWLLEFLLKVICQLTESTV
ncbi:WD40-repeat-containing domain protein, partial [Jimgerdemannia flammicorona]